MGRTREKRGRYNEMTKTKFAGDKAVKVKDNQERVMAPSTLYVQSPSRKAVVDKFPSRAALEQEPPNERMRVIQYWTCMAALGFKGKMIVEETIV